MMTLKGFVTSGLVIVTLILALPAFSKTPDGQTPAQENVCDPLRNATPGLYGLCVAYCEAHDADLISPSGDPNELNTPNQRILANYNRRKTESDPPMPCAVVQPEPIPEPELCPCWTSAELDELLPPATNFDHNFPHACRQTTSSTGAVTSVALENFEFGTAGPSYRISVINFEGCSVLKERFYPGGPPNGTSFATREEEESCRTLLIDHAREHMIGGARWDCFEQ